MKKKNKNNGKNAWICYTFWVVSLFCTFLLRPDCLVFQPDHLPVVCDNLVSDLCRVLAEKPVWEKEYLPILQAPCSWGLMEVK